MYRTAVVMGRGRAWGAGMGAFVSLFVYEGGFETIKGWEKLPASWVLFKTEH